MLEILSLGYMQRALLAGLFVGLICPAIGLILVLRRNAMYGDALGHVTLAGVAVGLLSGAYPVATGLVASVVASLGMDWLRRSNRKYGELSVSIVLSASLALAVILLSKVKSGSANILSYFFGSILTVSQQDLYLIGVLGALVLLTYIFLYKDLLALSFDEEFAQTSGLKVSVVNSLFLVLTALTVALTIRIVGVLLTSALMVVPVAVAMQVGTSFRKALLWSLGIGLVSVVSGLVLSYILGWASGGTIVLVAVAILLLVIVGKEAFRKR
jgi:zinc transport system permease protein